MIIRLINKLKNSFCNMSKGKILLITLLSFFLNACTDNRDEDTWLVATSADNPPYEYMHNGEIVGFDIDLMIEIGRHLGKKVEFKNMEFHGLLAALASDNVDMVVAAMSITPERLARVDFSIPYTDAMVAILYREEDKLSSKKDLKEKIVGAQLGTIWSLIAHNMSSKYNFSIKSLSNNLMLVEELKNNRIDAIIIEKSQVMKFIEKNPELASFSVKKHVSSFAIALPKDSPLKNNIDHAIESLKRKGTIEALSKKWGLLGAE